MLYHVKVETEMVVEADDEYEAAKVARENVEYERHNSKTSCVPLQRIEELPKPWTKASCPYGRNDAMTISQLLTG